LAARGDEKVSFRRREVGDRNPKVTFPEGLFKKPVSVTTCETGAQLFHHINAMTIVLI